MDAPEGVVGLRSGRDSQSCKINLRENLKMKKEHKATGRTKEIKKPQTKRHPNTAAR